MIITEELTIKSNMRARCAQIVATMPSTKKLTIQELITKADILFRYCLYNEQKQN